MQIVQYHLHTSLINKMNSIGDNILPCGTPRLILQELEKYWFNFTTILRSEKKEQTHSLTGCLMLINFFILKFLLTQSKAFNKSKNKFKTYEIDFES